MKDEEKYVWVKLFTYLVISVVIISLGFYTIFNSCDSRLPQSTYTYKLLGNELYMERGICNVENVDVMIVGLVMVIFGALILPVKMIIEMHIKYYKKRR